MKERMTRRKFLIGGSAVAAGALGAFGLKKLKQHFDLVEANQHEGVATIVSNRNEIMPGMPVIPSAGIFSALQESTNLMVMFKGKEYKVMIERNTYRDFKKGDSVRIRYFEDPDTHDVTVNEVLGRAE
jgi:hypothetical protein